eukprot:3122569-Rhodomonas_salina.2
MTIGGPTRSGWQSAQHGSRRLVAPYPAQYRSAWERGVTSTSACIGGGDSPATGSHNELVAPYKTSVPGIA